MSSFSIETRSFDEQSYQRLLESGKSPLLSKLCAARNVKTEVELSDDLTHLLPFTQLKNIDAMANRLADVILQQQKITIVADYDADGATACALGLKALGAMGAIVDFVVPNRFEYGYGLTPEIVDLAATQSPDVILTVDNGIASLAGIAHAQSLGIEVLVTDHHLPADTLPDCLIVNPNQPACSFSSKSLAGVGVLFYVLMALRACLRKRSYFTDKLPEPNLAQWLDLVALGTVADVVALDHNNRILVSQGLKRMRLGRMCPGILALFTVSGRKHQKATPFDLGFAIGPRINAAGRLDDMSLGIRCLISTSMDEAMELAKELDGLNQDRRAIAASMQQEALAGVEAEFEPQNYSVVAFREDWHQGVVGIVASRLKEHYHRPSIVFAPADNDEIRGSGRSIVGLHLRDALDWVSKKQPDLLLKFGGHAMAAGVSISASRLAEFQYWFEQAAQALMLPESLKQSFVTDGSLPVSELTLETARNLDNLVWGQGFVPPTFVDDFSVLWQRNVGKNHKKVGLGKSGQEYQAMLFNFTGDLPSDVTAVYRPVANEWNNQLELQLYIDYWQAQT